MSLELITAHRMAQINNGALITALVVELGEDLLRGKMSREEFVTAIVGADLLGHDAAVRLAAKFLRGLREEVGVGGELVIPEFDAGASAGRALWTLTEADEARAKLAPERDWNTEFRRIVEHLAVLSDRAAKMSGREMVAESAAASGRGWRRVTDGNPCVFCAMLASRGPVYWSAESAGSVTGLSLGGKDYRKMRRRDGSDSWEQMQEIAAGTRKDKHGNVKARVSRAGTKRRLGSQFHPRCGCTVVEQHGEWIPTPLEQRCIDAYGEASGPGKSTKEILAHMREYGGFNDSPAPKTQTGGAGGDKPPRDPRPKPPADSHDPWHDRVAGRVSPGRVTVPPGVQVAPHEKATAVRVAGIGADVLFRVPVNMKGVKNPDVEIDETVWELKAPAGSSEKSTISSQFKRGRRQAENIVIDLARCGLPDDVAIEQIKRRFYGQSRFHRVLIFDHSGKALYLHRP